MTGYDPRFPPFGTSGSGDASDWDDWDPSRARRGYTQQMPAISSLPMPPDPGIDLPGIVTPRRPTSGLDALGPAGLALSARAEKKTTSPSPMTSTSQDSSSCSTRCSCLSGLHRLVGSCSASC